jgi:hypothetical protein
MMRGPALRVSLIALLAVLWLVSERQCAATDQTDTLGQQQTAAVGPLGFAWDWRETESVPGPGDVQRVHYGDIYENAAAMPVAAVHTPVEPITLGASVEFLPRRLPPVAERVARNDPKVAMTRQDAVADQQEARDKAGRPVAQYPLAGQTAEAPETAIEETEDEDVGASTSEDSATEDAVEDMGNSTSPEDEVDEDSESTEDETADSRDADAEQDSDEMDNADDGTPEAPLPESEMLPPLSELMVKLRDQVRGVLAKHANQPLNTRSHTPADILHFCLPYGVKAKISTVSRSSQKVNAIGTLCWNYPCAGRSLLRQDEDRVMARVGYGLQQHPSQLLAVLALSKVPADYEIRVGDWRGSIADLAESEKLHCRRGSDLSLTLVGLSFYLDDEARWQSGGGQTWSLERLLREELDRTVDSADCDVTRRLMGLSFAVDRRIRRKRPVTGHYERARGFVEKFHDFALNLQNADGTWHPRFFAVRGSSRDVAGTVRSTGHILQWLVFSLPTERIEEPRVVRAVQYLANTLGGRRSSWSRLPSNPRDLGAMMHALSALAIYDQRVFIPRDAQEPATEEDAQTASTRSRPVSR